MHRKVLDKYRLEVLIMSVGNIWNQECAFIRSKSVVGRVAPPFRVVAAAAEQVLSLFFAPRSGFNFEVRRARSVSKASILTRQTHYSVSPNRGRVRGTAGLINEEVTISLLDSMGNRVIAQRCKAKTTLVVREANHWDL
jgi:hypothetical protein